MTPACMGHEPNQPQKTHQPAETPSCWETKPNTAYAMQFMQSKVTSYQGDECMCLLHTGGAAAHAA